MLLNRKQSGIFFAVWPRRTHDGHLVTMELLHWERVCSPGWGWGSGDTYGYRYTRLAARDARYNAAPGLIHGRRAQFYATPPDPKEVYCKNYRTDGPTPCHYPHCKFIDENGTSRCGVDHVAFGEM